MTLSWLLHMDSHLDVSVAYFTSGALWEAGRPGRAKVALTWSGRLGVFLFFVFKKHLGILEDLIQRKPWEMVNLVWLFGCSSFVSDRLVCVFLMRFHSMMLSIFRNGL